MVHEHARWAGWYPRMLWGSTSPCWVGRDGRYFSHACTLNVMWLPTTKLDVTPRETTALRFYASAGQIHQTWSFRGPGRQILLPSSRANVQTFVLFFHYVIMRISDLQSLLLRSNCIHVRTAEFPDSCLLILIFMQHQSLLVHEH